MRERWICPRIGTFLRRAQGGRMYTEVFVDIPPFPLIVHLRELALRYAGDDDDDDDSVMWVVAFAFRLPVLPDPIGMFLVALAGEKKRAGHAFGLMII